MGLARALAGATLLVACAAGTAGAEPAKGDPTKAAKPAAPVLAQQRPLDPRAFELNQEAVELYRAGEYRKAIVKLEAARKYDPDAKELLHNLATVHEKLAEVEPAIRYYTRYLEQETNAKAREKAEAALRRLEGARKDLMRAAPAEAPPPPPGRPEAPAPSRRPSPLVFVGIALTGTSLLLGSVLGLAAFLGQPSGKLTTGGGVTYQEFVDRAASAHAQAIAADVFFALGLAAGVGTVVLHIVTRPASGPQTAVAVRPGGAPGLGFAVSF